MSTAIDFRVSLTFFDHPKTMRLEAVAGEKAVLALLRLWGWASRHRSNGELTGLTSREIATAARWKGKADGLVEVLTTTGWLDRDGDRLHLHDWSDWQGWVCGSGSRSHAGRVAAMTKRCLLTGLSPDAYLDAQGGQVAMDADLREALRAAYAKANDKRAVGVRGALKPQSENSASRSGPSPSPSPSPTPTPSPTGERVGEAAASRPPSPDGSGAAPPGTGGSRCACGGVAQRSDPRGRCFACIVAGSGPLASRSPAEPAATAQEAPERGYALRTHSVGCSPLRPSWRAVGRPGPRRRWHLDDED